MSTAEPSTTGPKRSIEQSLTILAPVDAVWKALTDAEELTRWFPLEARVKPGKGGFIFNKWATDQQWEQPIVIWEENAHLRNLWCPAETPEPEQFGVDFFLEPKGEGETHLRLVHFGFGPAQEEFWDTMYDGVDRGWDFQLCALKRYLEIYIGRVRRVIYERIVLGDMPVAEAWETFLAPGMFAADESLLTASQGDELRTPLTSGDEIRGRVRRCIPSKDLQVELDNLGGGLLRIQTDPCGADGGQILTLFLGTFDIEKGEIDAMRERWRDALQRAFPDKNLA